MQNPLDLVYSVLRSAEFTITGRLTRDPELRFVNTSDGRQVPTCKLNLAVNKPGAKKDDGSSPDWFKADLWEAQAEQAQAQFGKGDLVSITGRIATESWTGQDGQPRLDLVLKQVSSLRLVRKPQGQQQQQPPAQNGWGAPAPAAAPTQNGWGAPAPAPAAAPAPAQQAAAWNSAPVSDDEIPF